MKKNRMMRLASVLLVCVLLTTSVISGTFAKYITTDAQYDTARVAKFGVVASLEGDLFGATYVGATNNSITSYSQNGDKGETVSSAVKTEFVVAPGTENLTGLTLTIKGTPEVSTKVILDAAENDKGADYGNSDIYLVAGTYGVMVPYNGVVTAENVGKYFVKQDASSSYVQATMDNSKDATVYELCDKADAPAEGYYPLTWTVKVGNTTKGNIKNVAEVKGTLDGYFNNNVTFNPNRANDMSANVTWSWAYGKAWEEKNGTNENIEATDKMDTILGNMMADQKESFDYDVVKVTENRCYIVSYADETVGATPIVVAKANGSTVACLTVAFNARLTVEQVD